MGIACHLGILLGEALSGVNDDDADIRPVHCHIGTQDAVLLDVVIHTGLAADAGGVDEHILAVFVFQDAVGGVPGGAGNIGYNGPLLTGHAVHQRALAHIGLADDGNLDVLLVILFPVLEVDVLEAGVQQVAGAMTMNRGNGNGITQTQVVELIVFRRNIADGIHLVDTEHHRLAALEQHGGHFLVVGSDAGAQVGDQYDDISALNGELGLAAHLGEDHIIGIGFDTAGIHQHDLLAPPFAGGVDAVPGHAGGILYNGKTLAHQLVEQGAFSHIGTSHNGNNRFRHKHFPPSSL